MSHRFSTSEIRITGCRHDTVHKREIRRLSSRNETHNRAFLREAVDRATAIFLRYFFTIICFDIPDKQIHVIKDSPETTRTIEELQSQITIDSFELSFCH